MTAFDLILVPYKKPKKFFHSSAVCERLTSEWVPSCSFDVILSLSGSFFFHVLFYVFFCPAYAKEIPRFACSPVKICLKKYRIFSPPNGSKPYNTRFPHSRIIQHYSGNCRKSVRRDSYNSSDPKSTYCNLPWIHPVRNLTYYEASPQPPESKSNFFRNFWDSFYRAGSFRWNLRDRINKFTFCRAPEKSKECDRVGSSTGTGSRKWNVLDKHFSTPRREIHTNSFTDSRVVFNTPFEHYFIEGFFYQWDQLYYLPLTWPRNNSPSLPIQYQRQPK